MMVGVDSRGISPDYGGAAAGEGIDLTFSFAKMWLWLVLWRASALLFASATLNYDFFSTNHHLEAMPTNQMNCYVYSRLGTHRFGRVYNDDWRSHSFLPKTKFIGQYPQYANHFNTNKFISRRLEHLAPKDNDLVKEHAKLVQDINSLKQYVFVAPFEDTRDYDESVYHEIIETTTIRPVITRTGPRPVKSPSFPVILLGGENTHHIVKTPYQSPFPKSTINLVGTTSSPLKHPYPFVMKTFRERPLKVCMPSLPPFPATTRRPSLWERLINSILPRPR